MIASLNRIINRRCCHFTAILSLEQGKAVWAVHGFVWKGTATGRCIVCVRFKACHRAGQRPWCRFHVRYLLRWLSWHGNDQCLMWTSILQNMLHTLRCSKNQRRRRKSKNPVSWKRLCRYSGRKDRRTAGWPWHKPQIPRAAQQNICGWQRLSEMVPSSWLWICCRM